ncbi:3-methyladenine DNA glycosylase AlkD [Lutispora thermophila DSM 19022]|uniref:3-methyladenine DNA glycosylase AlkD n=1 Tax=Lutispora thermophila DSM 19022 TaxID=1122184 RepID=A0A1M6GUV0_9FIRM|nr:DNA alkylation repair protein [Lutispora thermophila]SHJ13758.1 3-methyladenine DNA glycosylase AlkD [Lutispora thermophila DSM 19022]
MINNIISALYENADSEKALQMAAYMKDNFSFLGIQKPKRQQITKEFIKEAKKGKAVDWDVVDMLWNLPEREFQYLAVDYLIALKDYVKDEDIEKIEKLITTKSWWDTVDAIASIIVGEMCRKYPELIEKNIMDWAESSNTWLARTAILFQLRYKENTDTDLLSKIIKKNSEEKDFLSPKQSVGF